MPPASATEKPPAPEWSFDALRRALTASARELGKPTGALLFISGVPSPAARVAEVVAGLDLGAPVLVVPSAGVLTQAVEVEGVPAASGILFRTGRVQMAAGPSAEDVAGALGLGGTVVSFFASEGFESRFVQPLALGRDVMFGAGAPGASVYLVERGVVTEAQVAAARFDGSAAPIIDCASACRVVSDPLEVTAMEKGFVTRLGDGAALDVLSSKVGGGKHPGLVLVAILEQRGAGLLAEDRFLVRPIRGVDPARRAFAVASDVRVGDTIAFAVRDASSSRANLEAATRRAERKVLGSKPQFALYLSCAGRGRALYGENDVDIKLLKKRFGAIPLAGMHSAFEIVPWEGGGSRMQLMTGVLALFRSPS